MNDFNIIGNVYQCEVPSLVITTRSTIIANILGLHNPEKNDNDVKVINVDHQIVHYLPSGFENYFLNVEGLQITHCHLKEINRTNLEPFPHLRVLLLHNNDLISLESDLFQSNIGIRHINFENNSITYIGGNILENLHNLDAIAFLGNSCTQKNAMSKNEIQELLRIIRFKCQTRSGFIREQTLSSSTTTATTTDSTNVNDFVRRLLEEEILKNAECLENMQKLVIEVEDLKSKIRANDIEARMKRECSPSPAID